MKTYNKMLVFISVATLASAPLMNISNGIKHVNAVQTDAQQERQPAVSLGASLNEQQKEETLRLLGANQVTSDNTSHIDGTIVDKYLHDGSDASTPVYSSAYIQPMQEGHGVQVQIVTPQNILNVSQLTYQNAAITAGAKNAMIRVATVNPVTGDGALAGVYEVFAILGHNLKEEDVNTAQREINLVNEIEKTTGLNNNQMNLLFTELKKAVIEQGELGKDDVLTIAKELGMEIDDATAEQLLAFAQEFAKTAAAKNKETIDQLENSSVPAWKEVLPTLSTGNSFEEIEAREPLNYENVEDIRPEILALVDSYNQTAKDPSAALTYSYSFIPSLFYEDLNNNEKKILNDIRTELYFILESVETEVEGTSTIKDVKINNVTTFENLQVSHPELAEIFIQVGLANGMMPQAYAYHVVGQEGSRIDIEVYDDRVDKLSVNRYAYDTVTKEVLTTIDGKEYTPVSPVDLTQVFGEEIRDNRQSPTAIPEDYLVPEELFEKSFFGNDDEEEIEENSEETTEDSEATTGEEMTEEEVSEEDISEESSQNHETSQASTEEVSEVDEMEELATVEEEMAE